MPPSMFLDAVGASGLCDGVLEPPSCEVEPQIEDGQGVVPKSWPIRLQACPDVQRGYGGRVWPSRPARQNELGSRE